MRLNALSVDVEDYFQVSAFERDIERGRWDEFPSRVVANTRRLLEIFDHAGVKATFFILGWVAERFPELVREIAGGGHELASHSDEHRLVYELSPETFRADVRRCVEKIHAASGVRVVGYRAPSFSITGRSLWAMEILAEEGFEYDSSQFPIRHDRYGIPGGERFLHRQSVGGMSLWEFPPATVQVGRATIPCAGGGYFRLYPYRLTARMLTRINQRDQQPFVFYTHPWEFDPQQPRMRCGSFLSRRRHYVNLRSTERKLRQLLQQFPFGTLQQVIAAQAARVPG